MDNIRVSVVIPTYNCDQYIGNTILSVLNQTVLPDEIIIVDDGSKDHTVNIIKKIQMENRTQKIHLFCQRNSGPGAARNRGISEASFEWVFFLDGDDLWEKEKIKTVKEYISKNPEAVIVAHDEYYMRIDGQKVGEKEYHPIHQFFKDNKPLFPQLYRRNCLSTSCVCAKRDSVIAAGLFDSKLPSAQDYDMWIRLSEQGKLVYIPIPLESYIIRPGSISSNTFKRYVCETMIYERYAKNLVKYVGKRTAYFLAWRQITAAHVRGERFELAKGHFKNCLSIAGCYLPVLMRTWGKIRHE